MVTNTKPTGSPDKSTLKLATESLTSKHAAVRNALFSFEYKLNEGLLLVQDHASIYSVRPTTQDKTSPAGVTPTR